MPQSSYKCSATVNKDRTITVLFPKHRVSGACVKHLLTVKFTTQSLRRSGTIWVYSSEGSELTIGTVHCAIAQSSFIYCAYFPISTPGVGTPDTLVTAKCLFSTPGVSYTYAVITI